MTVLQIIQRPQLRGAEIFASQLSQHLTFLGHKVIIVALFSGNDSLPFNGKIINLNRSYSNRMFDFKGWKLLYDIIKQYQPDIIQCNAGDTLKYAVFSKFLYRWKAKVVTRNASMVSLYIKNPLVKILNSFFYRNVDQVVSVSENSKADILKLFPFVKDKITVIAVGVEHKEIHEVHWKNIKPSRYNLIHVGGFSFEKNHEGLLCIFKKFLEIKPDTHLHLLGKGALQNKIRNIAIDMEIHEQITFYDWLENPIDYIAKADVLLLPSIIEGLPGVVLESMWCKTPVVAYDVGGVREVVQPQKTGYLVDLNNESDFVNQILNALENPNQYVDNAYINISKNYTNIAIAKQFEYVYSLLLS